MRVPSFRKYSDFTKDSQSNPTYLLQWQVVSGFALKIVGQIIEEVFLEVLKECNLQYNLVFGASVILKQTPPPPLITFPQLVMLIHFGGSGTKQLLIY